MRFFPSSSLTGANRPRSRSSATSSSSSSIIDGDIGYGQDSSTTYSATQPPPPTRATTGLPLAPPFRALVPTVSPEMNSKATSIETNRRSTEPQPLQTNPLTDPSTSCTAYLYSTFPPEIFKEVETYDRRQANQTAEPPLHYFSDNKHAQYVCKECMVPLALQDEVVSKAFSGSLGRAYLLHSTVNTYLGKKEEKRLLTGIHTVADLHCMGCRQMGKKTTLGWMYLKAKERDQEYKEGKYILEAGRVIKENNWSLDD